MSAIGITIGCLLSFGIGVLVGVVFCEANAEKIIDRITRKLSDEKCERDKKEVKE